MSIQQRLLKARYSQYNLHMPSKKDLLLAVPNISRRHRENLVSLCLKDFMNVFIEPPKKDKHYKTYRTTIDDYLILSTRKNQAEMTHYAIKLFIYYLRNSEEYYGNYENFCIPFVSHFLFTMRKYKMRHMMYNGEIPMLYDLVCPQSNGYYPFPKPMGNMATVSMGNRLWNILEPVAIRYMSYQD